MHGRAALFGVQVPGGGRRGMPRSDRSCVAIAVLAFGGVAAIGGLSRTRGGRPDCRRERRGKHDDRSAPGRRRHSTREHRARADQRQREGRDVREPGPRDDLRANRSRLSSRENASDCKDSRIVSRTCALSAGGGPRRRALAGSTPPARDRVDRSAAALLRSPRRPPTSTPSGATNRQREVVTRQRKREAAVFTGIPRSAAASGTETP